MKATNTKMLNMNQWSEEIEQLIASSGPGEREALEAFRASMRPYLEDPKRLRTLLGKIAMTNGGSSPRMSLAKTGLQFKTIEEVRDFVNDESIQITLE